MDPLDRATIGRTNVEVTRLGLGTAPLGGWPAAVPATQAQATIRRAWDLGLRYFDTAPFYGRGLSEQNIGAALAREDRQTFTLSTKVGRLLRPDGAPDPLFQGAPPLGIVVDFSADGIHRSLAESRKRLGFDPIDIALIHDPDDHHELALRETYPVLAALRAQGDIRAIGVGMNWAGPLARFAIEADFDCMLVAGRYTLLEQDSLDDLMPALSERGMSLIAGGIFNSGLLIDPRPGATYNYAPAPEDLLARAQRLERACAEFDVPLRAAALQFPLAHPAVATVIVGARTPEEVEDNVAMTQLTIPGELWTRLKELDLLRADAPVPSSR